MQGIAVGAGGNLTYAHPQFGSPTRRTSARGAGEVFPSLLFELFRLAVHRGGCRAEPVNTSNVVHSTPGSPKAIRHWLHEPAGKPCRQLRFNSTGFLTNTR